MVSNSWVSNSWRGCVLLLLLGVAVGACGDSEPESLAPTEDATVDDNGTAELPEPDAAPASCTTSAECIDRLGTQEAPCVTGLCTADGECLVTPEPNGMSCGEGDVCSGPLECASGVCAATQLKCDDGTPCTDDHCDTENVVCVNTPVEDCHCLQHSDCVDDDPCDGGQLCVGSECTADPSTAIDCYTSDPCTEDSCDPAIGECVSVDNGLCECQLDSECEAGGLCDAPTTCVNFKCVPGEPKSCDDDDPCTLDACQMLDGSCTHSPNPDCGDPCVVDTDCIDEDLCDGPTLCEGGFCQAKSFPVTCDDQDPCTTDTCIAKTGVCDVEPIEDCPPGG